MRKLNFTLWLLALVGLMTSCSQDEAAGTQQMESDMVRIGASISPQTRAGTPIKIPEDLQLRYVLEVWIDAAIPTLVWRDEQVQTGQSGSIEFSFTLSETGLYKAVVWADFIDKDAATVDKKESPNDYTSYADKYYNTNTSDGLRQVTLNDLFPINNSEVDAFCASVGIKKEVGALTESVELKRPFGQIIILEKNVELLDKLENVNFKYSVPSQYNVMKNEVGKTLIERKGTSVLVESPVDGSQRCIFFDYIFAPVEGQTSLGQIALTFDCKDPAFVLNPFTIPANMPVVHNKRTIISGSILHDSPKPSDAAELNVTISNEWTEPSEEKVLPGVGDYFYKDRTYSSTPQTDKELVGIVFWINPDDWRKGKIVSTQTKGRITWEEAMNWTNPVELPAGMSWRIPTRDELQHLFCAYNGSAPATWNPGEPSPERNEAANAAFDEKVSLSLGGSNVYYWSCTEDEDHLDNAWIVVFGLFGGNMQSNRKDDRREYTRACFISDF